MHDSAFIEAQALRVLDCADLDEKLRLTGEIATAWMAGSLAPGWDQPPQRIEMPGRPPRPRLVAPANLPRRGLQSDTGRAALIHAIAHIELNAVDLAWDAVYRFRDWPNAADQRAFIDDWVAVATDEARHFGLLRGRLRDLGARYGDFDAHNGLWEAALRTMDDVMARMALVPRVLEARGLDVTPAMIERLRGAGDPRTVAILEIILREEVAHVAAGTRWFRYWCERRGLESRETFMRLLRERFGGRVKGPFNEDARRAAGFSEEEMRDLRAASA